MEPTELMNLIVIIAIMITVLTAVSTFLLLGLMTVIFELRKVRELMEKYYEKT